MKKISILIVEDEFAIAEEMRLQLSRFGLEVMEPVDNGKEALEAFKSQTPDLVLMDIQLSGEIDGIEVAKKMRQHQSIPIIYVTGNEDDHYFKKALELTNPEGFLYKPVNPIMLYRQIDLAIQKQLKEEQYLKDSFFISNNNKTFSRVSIKELICVRAARSFCDIYTDNTKFTASHNLVTFLELYQHPQLVRIHRSHAINIERVEGLLGNQLLVSGEYFTIGKSYLEDIKNRLNII